MAESCEEVLSHPFFGHQRYRHNDYKRELKFLKNAILLRKILGARYFVGTVWLSTIIATRSRNISIDYMSKAKKAQQSNVP